MTQEESPSDDDEIEDVDENQNDDEEYAAQYWSSAPSGEGRLETLLSEARARVDSGDLPFDSNYEYVRDRINNDDYPQLEEKCWQLGEFREELHGRINSSREQVSGLLVDDDPFVAREYGSMLEAAGIHVTYAFNADDALRIANHFGDIFEFIVIDIRMPTGDLLGSFETVGGSKTGVILAREIAALASSAKLIALSNSTESLDIAWFESREACSYCSKRQFSPERFAKFVQATVMKNFSRLKTFIIHGHDKAAARSLKDYLQSSLGFADPIILSEQKSKGMTVIEKLEHYLADVDLVFALFTPDDFVTHPSKGKRPRQNVVLEFGYVLGKFGRRSGRIFYLYKEGVEIPSDLGGVIHIDISNGVQSAGEEIRLELEGLFES
jgi:predicted nucleotide-binding protein